MLPILMIPGVSDLLPSIPGMDLLPTTSEMYNVKTPLRLSTIGSFVCCMFMFVNVIQKLGPLPKGPPPMMAMLLGACVCAIFSTGRIGFDIKRRLAPEKK